jgi:hypothetical protein
MLVILPSPILELKHTLIPPKSCELRNVPQLLTLDALPNLGVNPLEGSPIWSCGIGTRKGAPDFQHYKGVEGRAKSPGIKLGRRTSRSSLILHPK